MNRVTFVEPCSREVYLRLYQELDIVLDSFPYNGHTTSLDALWMGVPVVSRVGDQAVSRAGLSQLSNIGLPELAAFSDEDFVRIAADLSRGVGRLKELRATLRERMRGSILMDAGKFTHGIESAYRQMWRDWCRK
jgi:predicted O-linked N-acetylglucosamine transferase (SPINDLY family)